MYDYVIVGGGSAGCVLAHRLSADPGHRVLLIEAGRDERRMEVTTPAAWLKLFGSPCDWAYRTEPNAGLNGRSLYFPRGRMLGGTSAMNAMVYLRGTRTDFDEWSRGGSTGWSYDEVLPYFRRSEDNSRGASPYHGADGPLAVCDARERNPLSEAFVEAVAACGVPRNSDFNGATQDGVGFVQTTIRDGRRCSAADAFLRPVRGRPNLTVVTNAHATQVVLEGRRAAGVRYVQQGRVQVARAAREVVLSCGAVDSPKLLMLSGIGRADELRRLGVDVKVDLPGVGTNLQDHPIAPVRVRCRGTISLLGADSPGNLVRYLLFRRGPLASNGPEAVAFVHSEPGLDQPDLEIIQLPVLWLNEGLTAPTEHGYTVAVMVLKPRSRGCVRLRSADPLAAPVIDGNHFSDPEGDDMRRIVTGLRMARQFIAAPPLAALSAGEAFPGSRATTDEALAAAVRAEGQTCFHPVGTCAMGADGGAVVDPSLRVHGVDGLRVVDASVMPAIVRGHTNAAAIMIGEKGADLILGSEAAIASPKAATRTTTLSGIRPD